MIFKPSKTYFVTLLFIYIKDRNEWQICYSNICIHYSNVFEYSDREIFNVFIEISNRRDVRVSSLTQGVF